MPTSASADARQIESPGDGAQHQAVEAPNGSEDSGGSGEVFDSPASPRREDEALLRALADLDNLRKRCSREVERARVGERDQVVAELFSVVDNLERAMEHLRAVEHLEADPSSVVAGIEAVHEHALQAISRLGYERFGEAGERFDPRRHEALSATVAGELEPGTVARVVRPGYARREVVIRPAAVVVAQRPASARAR